jgi:hypothetical protein
MQFSAGQNTTNQHINQALDVVNIAKASQIIPNQHQINQLVLRFSHVSPG